MNKKTVLFFTMVMSSFFACGMDEASINKVPKSDNQYSPLSKKRLIFEFENDDEEICLYLFDATTPAKKNMNNNRTAVAAGIAQQDNFSHQFSQGLTIDLKQLSISNEGMKTPDNDKVMSAFFYASNSEFHFGAKKAINKLNSPRKKSQNK